MAVDNGHENTPLGQVHKLVHAALTSGSARTHCTINKEQWDWVQANPLYLDSNNKFGDVCVQEGRACKASVPEDFIDAYTQEFMIRLM
jgi:hypothetical protein